MYVSELSMNVRLSIYKALYTKLLYEKQGKQVNYTPKSKKYISAKKIQTHKFAFFLTMSYTRIKYSCELTTCKQKNDD